MSKVVECTRHGRQGIGLACVHVAVAIDPGADVGFFHGDETDTARPDAWCADCERRLCAIDASDTTQVAWFEAADFKILCSACWDLAREVLSSRSACSTSQTASRAASQPKFPAIAVCSGDSFSLVSALPSMGTWRAFRAGYFHRVYLVDREGIRWAAASPVMKASFFDRLLARRVRLRFDVTSSGPADVREVVRDLHSILNRSEGTGLYPQLRPIAETKRALDAAGDIERLFAAVRDVFAE
jgi:hypothetical protein